MIRFIFGLLISLAFVAAADAQHWQWTPPAAHHAAVVQVTSSDGSSGTGVHFGGGWILTAAHVAETRQGFIVFPSGKRYDWVQSRRDYQGDVDISVLWARCEHEPAAPIAGASPQPGEMIELVGLGGPGTGGGKKYRHFSMRVLNETGQTRLVTDGVVTYGDSGAPAFNARGEVVGVQSAGRNKIQTIYAGGAKWDALTPALLTNVGPIRRLLGWSQGGAGCFGGQCPPSYGGHQGSPGGSYGGGGRGGDISQWYPPDQPAAPQQPSDNYGDVPPAPQPQQPQQPSPGQVAGCECDPAELQAQIDQLKERIEEVAGGQLDQEQIAAVLGEVIAANPDRFRGPQGPAGKDGKDATVNLPALVAMVNENLPPLTIKPYESAPGQQVRLGETVVLPSIRFDQMDEGEFIQSIDVPLGGYLEIDRKARPYQAN